MGCCHAGLLVNGLSLYGAGLCLSSGPRRVKAILGPSIFMSQLRAARVALCSKSRLCAEGFRTMVRPMLGRYWNILNVLLFKIELQKSPTDSSVRCYDCTYTYHQIAASRIRSETLSGEHCKRISTASESATLYVCQLPGSFEWKAHSGHHGGFIVIDHEL